MVGVLLSVLIYSMYLHHFTAELLQFFSLAIYCLKLTLWLSPTLSRSLILCHSKTNDHCPEERHAGEVADGCRTWGPGCRADGTAGDQTRYRDTENRHWRATQQSAQEKRGGTEADNQLHHTTTLRENKRSIRRSFSIKVWLCTSDPFPIIIWAYSWTNCKLSHRYSTLNRARDKVLVVVIIWPC